MLLDSSVILSCFEFSIDLESELTRLLGSYKIVVPSSVVHELEKVSKKGDGFTARNASASLSLIKKYDVVEIQEQNTDDSLVLLSKKLDAIVATNDKALRKKLREEKRNVIFLRSKHRFQLD